MPIPIWYFYVEDLRRLGATISSFPERTKFMAYIADNTNYQFQAPDGRLVAKLYSQEADKVHEIELASGITCSEVLLTPGE